MDAATLKMMLERVAKGESSPGDAAKELLSGGVMQDIGYARLDLSRQSRCGFPEFIFGEGKTTEQLCGIMAALKDSGRPVLATRVNAGVAEAILPKFPDASYDPLSKTLSIRQGVAMRDSGKVCIVAAGTSDIPVALEAKTTAELCGCDTMLLADMGVAGMHRLMASMDTIREASVVIAVAGMEGALPSVIAGMVSSPVIAVPTSVGYGASFKGIAALLAMLNSCASGVLVVNVDNGFGAGCAAARMLPLPSA